MPTADGRPVVVVGFDGGLGNQMFQYAAGKALALRSNGELLLDTSHFHAGSQRRFGLRSFNITARSLSLVERHAYGLDSYAPAGDRSGPPPKGIGVLVEKYLGGVTPIPARIRRDLYLNGSWFHHQHFQGHADAIRREFTLRAPSPGQGGAVRALADVTAVAVHVRRTDFLSGGNESFNVCSVDYFVRGMALVRERVPDAVFCVFSDDIRWVSHNVPIDGPHLLMPANVEHPAEDLALMASCRHFVIANSTFSWWGAFLGSDPGKIVVTPSEWYRGFAGGHPAPPDWVRIPP